MAARVNSILEMPLPLYLQFRREFLALKQVEEEGGIPLLKDYAGKTGHLVLGSRRLAKVRVVKEGDSFKLLDSEFMENETSLEELFAKTRVQLCVFKGSCRISPLELKNLGEGSILDLEEEAGAPAVLRIPDLDFEAGVGEVVTIGNSFGIRMTEMRMQSAPKPLRRPKIGEIGPPITIRALVGTSERSLGELFSIGEGTIIELDETIDDSFRALIENGPSLPVVIEGGDNGLRMRIVSEKPKGIFLQRESGNRSKERQEDTHTIEKDLAAYSSAVLTDFCSKEAPQAAALLFASLDIETSREVLSRLDNDRSAAVLSALASLDPSAASGEVSELLFAHIAALAGKYGEAQDLPEAEEGTPTLLERTSDLIAGLPEERQKELLEAMEELSSELAAEVEQRILRFEDISLLSDKNIQKLLRELDSDLIVKALSGASQELREAILRNTSQRSRKMLMEDVKIQGNLPRETAENARKQILNVFRILEEQGDIVISREED